MFFQLFKEFEDSFGQMKTILSNQITYITKPIPAIRYHQHIQQQLQKMNHFHLENGKYYIQLGRNGSAKLEIFERFLLIEAHGSYEAETTFFEILRKNERSLLALDLMNNHYGWLRPIKERKFV